MTSAEHNKAAVLALVEACNTRDWDRLRLYVSHDLVLNRHARGNSWSENRDEFVCLLQKECDLFPDAQETLADLFADVDRVAARHCWMGTHLPTGQLQKREFLAWYRLVEGRIVEVWMERGCLSEPITLVDETALVRLPDSPCYAVVFTSIRTSGDHATYGAMADRMVTLATEMPGFLGLESVRGTDGLGITVSYWASQEAIRAWQQHAEHLQAQQLGRKRWYAGFELRICRVERVYGFRRGVDQDTSR